MSRYDLVDANGQAISKRLRYFDGQFLQDGDFIDEQKYHLDRRQRLTRALHAAGVVEGLTLRIDRQNIAVVVEPGTAIDRQGRQIVLPAAVSVSLAAAAAGDDLVLTLAYSERSSDPAVVNLGAAGDTRFHETPVIALEPRSAWESAQRSGSSSTIPLGRVVMTQDTSDASRVTFLDGAPFADVRATTGLQLPGANGTTPLTLRAVAGAPAGTAELTANLEVTGTAGFGTAPRENVGLTVSSEGGRIVANGLYFTGSEDHSDGLPRARLIDSWGMRYASPDHRWPLSTANSLLVGYAPTGENWGAGNLLVQGKVGIGTSAPSEMLEVSGGAKLSQSLSVGADLSVSGNATIDQGLTLGAGLQVAGTLSAGKIAASRSAADANTLLLELPAGVGHRENGQGKTTGIVLRATTFPPDAGDPLFQVRSPGQAVRFFVEHEGYTGARDNSAWFGGSRTNTFLGPLAIGTVAAPRRLELRGDLRFNDNDAQRIYGATVDGRSTVVVSGHFNELRIKGRVLDWTGGPLQLGLEGDSLSQEVVVGGSLLRVKKDQMIEGRLSFTNVEGQRVNLYGTAHGMGVQSFTTYFRSTTDFAWFRGGKHADGRGDAGGGTADMILREGMLGIGTPNGPTQKLEVAGDFALGSPVSSKPATGSTYAGARTLFGGVYEDNTPMYMGRYLTASGTASSPQFSSMLRVNLGNDSKQGVLQVGYESSAGWLQGLGISAKGAVTVGGHAPFRLVYVSGFRDAAVTDLEYSLYEAMIVGFRSGSGDINENYPGTIIQMYTTKDEGGRFWKVCADFRSHETHETWDVWVMGVIRSWVAGARS